VGKWHTKVQTNYFSRNYDPNANSGSGNEQFHELGFDVTQNYAAYSFRWRKDRLDWWVNGKHIRVAFAGDDLPPIPNPEAISMKVFANIWAVNKQAEEWAGPLDHEFYETAARYNWMWHDPGENCNIMTDCGPIPPGL
jgi:beta-glucanase (GH16 family)